MGGMGARIATAVKLLGSLRSNLMGPVAGAAFALLTFACIVGLRWPLLWVLGGLGSVAVATAWWRLRPR